jgi:hypothetical protein
MQVWEDKLITMQLHLDLHKIRNIFVCHVKEHWLEMWQTPCVGDPLKHVNEDMIVSQEFQGGDLRINNLR